MPVRIVNQTCFFKVTDHGPEHALPAAQVTVSTDSARSMSFIEFKGDKVYITEAEADTLTIAGATDGRKHLKATDSGSVI